MYTDITYLARGLLGLKSDYEDEDDSGCSDLDEPFVPNNDFDYMDVLFSPYEMNIPLVDCHQPSLIELEWYWTLDILFNWFLIYKDVLFIEFEVCLWGFNVWYIEAWVEFEEEKYTHFLQICIF